MKKKQKNKIQNNINEGVNIEFTPLSSSEKLRRKCIACSKIASRNNFIRIMVRHDDKKVIINPDKKTFGRSLYLCYNNDCINKAFKKNKISKILKAKVDDSFINEIKGLLGETNKK